MSAKSASSAQSPLVRDTAYGQVEGAEHDGAYSWRGIPFAKPPVGALRWRAPLEPDAWPGIRPAKTFGNACAQAGRLFGPGANNRYDATIGATLDQTVGSEDCLTLNIWRPTNGEHGLPVICFIHGGSNICGYTADPVYDGSALARAANAVVVTANYRLGLLGWFAMPALRTGDDPTGDSGNFGTLDQIQTLKFINRNIASFGGDPHNVTLMGESAGAVNVYALLTSPLMVAHDPPLFHKAVPLSGGLALPDELPRGAFPTILPESYALAQSAKLLAGLLVADGVASDEAAAAAYAATLDRGEVARYLRSKSPAELFEQLLTRLKPAGLGAASHIPDGNVVAARPIAAIASGNYVKVPVLAGNTRDEGHLFFQSLALSPALGGEPALIVSDAERFELMRRFDPDAAPTVTLADLVEPAYLPVDAPTTGFKARLGLYGRLLFGANRDVILNAIRENQPDVWCYRFDWDEEPPPWNDVYGAAHAFDLHFIFGNFGPSLFSNVIGGKANEAGRRALSAAMMRSLAAFAHGGDPNTPELGVTWPAWPRVLHFDASLAEKRITVV